MLLEKQQNKQAFINWLQLFMNGMTNGGTYAAHFMAAASIKSKQLEFLKWKQPSAPSKYNCNQRPMQFKHRQILQHHSTICLEINISSHDYYSRPIDFILLYQVKSKLPSAYIVKQHCDQVKIKIPQYTVQLQLHPRNDWQEKYKETKRV